MRKFVKYFICSTNFNSLYKNYSVQRFFKICSTCFSNSQEKQLNPFKKRKYKGLSAIDYDQKISNRMVVTILGNGALGQPRCVGLFTENRGFLFNCGEGVGRLCREYEITTLLIRHVFFTQRSWANMSGFPDIYITNEVYGVKHMSIYGPPGIEGIKSMISSSRFDLEMVKRHSYADDNLAISSVSIKSKYSGGHAQNDIVFSYICKICKKLGELDPEKCVEHAVPIGPHLLKLKNGEDVVLPSGRLVCSADVLFTTQPATTLLIVDCPSKEFLDPFIENEDLNAYQLPIKDTNEVTQIYHFSPPHIFYSRKYQIWMKKFPPGTQHFILNSSNPYMSSEVICETQSILNLIHPEVFRLLPLEKKDSSLKRPSSIIQTPPMLQIQIRPEGKIRWDNVVTSNYVEGVEALRDDSYFQREFEKIQSYASINSKQEKKSILDSDFPEVLFLGTSSATSTASRNVSAILVKTNRNNSVLLDSGEGTVLQMVRYFGKPNVLKELCNISTIFISHVHTDHYLGLFEVIKARAEAFENLCLSYQPVDLVIPFPVRKLFYTFCEMFERIQPKVRIHSCKKLSEEKDQFFINGNVMLQTVPVVHCLESYGIILESESDWKIVYSGDCAPSQKLIDAGENCTLLIHEASMEENLISEATSKKHSTVSQVVDIAERMNARYAIATHFSKRYLGVPVFKESYSQNLGFAFDFMKVRLRDLALLPKFIPLLKYLFQQELNEHLQKSTNTARNESVFLKKYRSIRGR